MAAFIARSTSVCLTTYFVYELTVAKLDGNVCETLRQWTSTVQIKHAWNMTKEQYALRLWYCNSN